MGARGFCIDPAGRREKGTKEPLAVPHTASSDCRERRFNETGSHKSVNHPEGVWGIINVCLCVCSRAMALWDVNRITSGKKHLLKRKQKTF